MGMGCLYVSVLSVGGLSTMLQSQQILDELVQSARITRLKVTTHLSIQNFDTIQCI